MLINKKEFIPKRFSSGELKLYNTQLNDYIINNKVEILFENDLSLFELFLIIEYYIKNNVKIDLILSYLPYQRMEHKGRDELDTLSYVAKLFNSFKLDSITLCEPHCEIKEFKNSKKLSFVDLIKNTVFKQINFDLTSDYIVLTDKGGFKRYKNTGKNTVYFNKERDIHTGLIVKQKIIGKVDINKKILIVDDIISTGDTIVNIIEYLTTQGANEIYVLSGHIENNKYNKRIEEFSCVKKIFSTNSLKKRGNKKIKLYDIREIIYGQKYYR